LYPDLIALLCGRYESFRRVYARAKKIQEQKLVSGAIHGDFKEQITKFVLINHHDYRDKSESHVTGNQTLNVTVTNYARDGK
jgi:hypothetical protein